MHALLHRILGCLGTIAICAAGADHVAAAGRHGVGAQQASSPTQAEPGPLQIPDARIEPVEWSALDGWSQDDHARAFATFLASCRPIVRATSPQAAPPMRTALAAVCRRALSARRMSAVEAGRFFETNFRPARISRLGEEAGFVTGYYEPIVEGSRFPTRYFTVPIYRRPPDLVAPGVPANASFPNKGRVVRLTGSGEYVPYYDRGEIEDGALDGRRLEICWLRNATEALIIQIQGSARVRLEDGTILRINYAAHNGFPYTPVGRVLIDRNVIPREEMSMQRIRDWMLSNPEDAKEVRRQNKSFVFFRIAGLSGDREAVGGEGIPLTPERSIAVDTALHVYGTPFFIAADLPGADGRSRQPFRRTMIAQDTGSAIVGPARADLYFGAGEEAGRIAGRIRQSGHFAMLIPREIDPVAAGARMPLPRAKPPEPPPEPVAAGAPIPLPRAKPPQTSPQAVEAGAGPSVPAPTPPETSVRPVDGTAITSHPAETKPRRKVR